MQKFFFPIIVAFLATNATAGQSPWVEVAPNARLRMIFSDVLSAQNQTMVAMELEMPQGTKTYWRVPGETGVPFKFDISQSNELSTNEIIWPFPERIFDYGYVDFVYHRNLVLPIQLDVDGNNPVLKAELFLGVCSDICVPVTVQIEHQLDFEKRDSRAALLIAQSMANAPIPWDQETSPFGTANYDADAEQIVVQIHQPDMDIESLIATVGNGFTVFGAPKENAQGTSVTFDKIGGGDISDQNLTLTFMSLNGPYEIVQPLHILQ